MKNCHKQKNEDVLGAGKLSLQESLVLQALAKGLTIKQAASEMSLSVHTVDTYVRRIYVKLGVHSRAQAVMWYASTHSACCSVFS